MIAIIINLGSADHDDHDDHDDHNENGDDDDDDDHDDDEDPAGLRLKFKRQLVQTELSLRTRAKVTNSPLF